MKAMEQVMRSVFVTFNFSENGERGGSAEVSPKEVEEEKEPKQSEAQTTDGNSGYADVLERTLKTTLAPLTVVVGSQLLLLQH